MPQDIDAIISEFARKYPPLITVTEAAQISRRKIQTIYDLSSRGQLDGCKLKRGGILLFTLSGFVRFLFDDSHSDDNLKR